MRSIPSNVIDIDFSLSACKYTLRPGWFWAFLQGPIDCRHLPCTLSFLSSSSSRLKKSESTVLLSSSLPPILFGTKMPSKSVLVHRVLCGTRILARPHGPPSRAFWRGVAAKSKENSSKPEPGPAVVSEVRIPGQSRVRLKINSRVRGVWRHRLDDTLDLITPWLEIRQLAHPEWFGQQEFHHKVCVGLTWFSDEAESFVSIPPSLLLSSSK